jgi:ABC-2 type transport system ATP-binding protein
LSEVEQVCSHAAIMRGGHLVAHGTLTELGAGAEPRLRVETSEPERAAGVLERLGLHGAASSGQAAEAVLDGIAPERATVALVEAGVPVRGLSVQRPSLEETYVALTGEGFDVDE